MFVIRIKADRTGVTRDELIERLKDCNIGTSVHYIPTHTFSAYRAYASDALRATERIWSEMISLPLYSTMSDLDVEDVISSTISCLKQPGVLLAG
jgi:dTDP-4-amino-4,6-dideoxygalactose transaminase